MDSSEYGSTGDFLDLDEAIAQLSSTQTSLMDFPFLSSTASQQFIDEDDIPEGVGYACSCVTVHL
jgi:hypothetical protein